METVKLGYFTIKRCGYYKHGAEAPEFSPLADTLGQLSDWIRPKSLRETKVFDPVPDQNLLPVYVKNLMIDPATGDALLVTWNAAPANAEGRVAAAAGDDPVGDVDLTEMNAPDGSIPGYPSYFYFIPERSVVVATRFEGQVYGGQPGVVAYMNEVLAKFSRHVVVSQNDDGVDIFGYVRNHGDEPAHVHPSYRTEPKRVPGEVDWLRQNCASIRKMVRRDRITTGALAGRAKQFSIWNFVGITDPIAPASGMVKFNFDIDCRISEAQLDSLIAFGNNEHESYTDIGFKIKGGNETHWVSHCLVKQELSVDIQHSAGFATAQSLFDELRRKRADVLSVVRDD